MTARGGRLPSDQAGRPTRVSGIGQNSERVDLQQTPGLRDSDLQQGDVQALEQGLRTAPIQEQAPASAAPAPRAPAPAPSGPVSEVPGIEQIIEQRLGGTLGTEAVQAFDPVESRVAQGWAGFFRQVAKNPSASPILKAKARDQIRNLERSGGNVGRSTFLDLNDADDALDTFLSAEGF